MKHGGGGSVKLAVAGFSYGTISFWSEVMSLDDFERTTLYGEEVLIKLKGTNTAIGGFIKVCEGNHVDLVPICAARGGATATVVDEVYDHYVPYILKG
jgi:hypothetical protein